MADFSLGGGIALPLVKYLPRFGCRPFIITNNTRAPNSVSCDRSLAGRVDIYKTVSLNKSPFRIFSKFFHSWETAALLERFFFVPDILITWLPSAVLSGRNLLKKEKIDTVLTVSPPESTHLIGLALSRMTGCRWIADFEDLWTTKKVVYQPPTAIHDQVIKRMERSIYKHSGHLLANTYGNRQIYQNYFRIPPEKISVISGGYDPEDLEGLTPADRLSDNGAFNIGYMGKFDKAGFPWKQALAAIRKLTASRPGIKLRLNICGHVADETRLYIRANRLDKYVFCNGVFPHTEAVRRTIKNDALLLLLYETPYSRSIVPHKLYYYLAMGKPILAIAGEKGETAAILNDTGAGKAISVKNPELFYDTLTQYYDEWESKGSLVSAADPAKIAKYDITQNAQKLADIIKSEA